VWSFGYDSSLPLNVSKHVRRGAALFRFTSVVCG
jgi:hypothetical protein